MEERVQVQDTLSNFTFNQQVSQAFPPHYYPSTKLPLHISCYFAFSFPLKCTRKFVAAYLDISHFLQPFQLPYSSLNTCFLLCSGEFYDCHMPSLLLSQPMDTVQCPNCCMWLYFPYKYAEASLFLLLQYLHLLEIPLFAGLCFSFVLFAVRFLHLAAIM